MPFTTPAIHQCVTQTRQETHQAPDEPFAIAQAHAVMQFHVACRAKRCPRKAAALLTLIDAGRVVPSTSKPS
ncbi:hypothetical protein [Nocardia sp. BMG111209]|uniref:hypothetical protein n=1 Tax=Nocardia sp. BMG111209 TaxID=1160137 RepID=UPI0012DF1EE3|nr:hypothetical protein [Nocardia sp. BMG111209]